MSRSYPAWVLLFLSGVLLVLLSVPGAQADNSPPGCLNDKQAGLMANTLTISSDSQLRPLTTAYFVDESGSKDIGEIITQPFSADGCLRQYPVPSPHGSLWLRFDVTNSNDSAKTWFVGFKQVNIDELVLFEHDADGVREVSKDGRTVPVDQRAGNLFKTGIPIQLGANATTTYYLKISGVFPPVATPALVTAKRFAGWSTTHNTVSMLVLGFTGMMALVSLVVFRHVDPQFYLFYTLYMLSRFGFTFFSDGWLPQEFGVTLSGTASTPLAHLFAGLGPFCMVLFCRALLSQGHTSKVRERMFGLLLIFLIIVTVLAVIRPWEMYRPLHMSVVITPSVLFFIALARCRAGLVQAKWICAGLASLMCGLSMAMYYYTFQSNIIAPTSVLDLISMRPLLLGYFAAVFIEPICMMIAISTLMKMKNQDAVMQMAHLRQDVIAAERHRAEIGKNAGARIERLEATLASGSGKRLLPPIEQRFLDRATDCTLNHVAEEGFGARELASALGVSEKTLGRRLKQGRGLSPAAFIRSVRLNNARDLILLRQHSTVAEVAHAAGFSSVSHFAKLYRRHFSETPSETLKLLKAAAE